MNLDEGLIYEIANSKTRSDSIELIRQYVFHSRKSPSDESRNEILFDTILDLVHFCMKKGYSLSETVACCQILYTLIRQFYDTRQISHSLAESLDIFSKRILFLSKSMNQNKSQQFIDYMNMTFFTHFTLFKYVFTNDRENNVYTERRFVNCPVTDESEEDLTKQTLSQAKHFQLWEYENEIRKLEDNGLTIRNKYDKEREQLLEKQYKDQNVLKDYSQDGTQFEVNEQIIQEMLRDLSLPMVDTAYLLVKTDIKEFGELHEVKVKKSALVKPETIVFTPNPKKSNSKNKAKK